MTVQDFDLSKKGKHLQNLCPKQVKADEFVSAAAVGSYSHNHLFVFLFCVNTKDMDLYSICSQSTSLIEEFPLRCLSSAH